MAEVESVSELAVKEDVCLGKEKSVSQSKLDLSPEKNHKLENGVTPLNSQMNGDSNNCNDIDNDVDENSVKVSEHKSEAVGNDSKDCPIAENGKENNHKNHNNVDEKEGEAECDSSASCDNDESKSNSLPKDVTDSKKDQNCVSEKDNESKTENDKESKPESDKTDESNEDKKEADSEITTVTEEDDTKTNNDEESPDTNEDKLDESKANDSSDKSPEKTEDPESKTEDKSESTPKKGKSKTPKKRDDIKHEIVKRVTRSATGVSKQVRYTDTDLKLDLVIDDEIKITKEVKKNDEIEMIEATDPLAISDADVKKAKETKKENPLHERLKSIKANPKISMAKGKDNNVIIIDTNTLLKGQGPTHAPSRNQNHGPPVQPIVHRQVSAPTPNTQTATATSIQTAIQAITGGNPAIQGLQSAYLNAIQQVLAQGGTQMSNPNCIATLQQYYNTLGALQDDAYVIEAPSFIVPYVMEGNPKETIKNYLVRINKELEEYEKKKQKEEKSKGKEDKTKEKEDKMKEDKEKEKVKEDKEKEDEDIEKEDKTEEEEKMDLTKESKEEEEEKEETEKSKEDPEKEEESSPKKAEAKEEEEKEESDKKEKEDEEKMEVSEKEDEEEEPEEVKAIEKTSDEKEDKKTDKSITSNGEVDEDKENKDKSTEDTKEDSKEKKEEDSKKDKADPKEKKATEDLRHLGRWESYYKSALGKFVLDLGLNHVQEFIQSDLLRMQKRRLDKKAVQSRDEVTAFRVLEHQLKFTKEKNEHLQLSVKTCRFCTYKTESTLVMKRHLESPHMMNYTYKCNFCEFETRGPQVILFHVEAEHNVRGRLERAPAFFQCPMCPYEDNNKSKMSRHAISCAKKFKAEKNCELSDWEPPAKIPKIIRGRPSTFGGKNFDPRMSGVLPKLGGSGLGVINLQNVITSSLLGQASSAVSASMAAGRGRGMYQGRTGSNFIHGVTNAQQLNLANQVLQSVTQGSGSRSRLSTSNSGQTGNLIPGIAGSSSITIQSVQNKSGNSKSPQQPSISITPLPRAGAGQPTPKGAASNTSSSGGSRPAFVICEICDGYIKDLEQLRNHMNLIHKVKIHPKMIYNRPPLNCQKCQHRFFTDQGLERHLLGTHGLVTSSMQEAANKGKDAGRCPICGKVFQWKLLNHVSRDHKMTLKPAHLSYKCTVCTATFNMYRLFENHVYSAHSVVNKNKTDSPSASSPANTNSSAASKKASGNDGPLKINDEITIIPQPASKSPKTSTDSAKSTTKTNKSESSMNKEITITKVGGKSSGRRSGDSVEVISLDESPQKRPAEEDTQSLPPKKKVRETATSKRARNAS